MDIEAWRDWLLARPDSQQIQDSFRAIVVATIRGEEAEAR